MASAVVDHRPVSRSGRYDIDQLVREQQGEESENESAAQAARVKRKPGANSNGPVLRRSPRSTNRARPNGMSINPTSLSFETDDSQDQDWTPLLGASSSEMDEDEGIAMPPRARIPHMTGGSTPYPSTVSAASSAPATDAASACGTALSGMTTENIDSILLGTCGTNRDPMIITYDWIPGHGKPKPEHVREQLKILGNKDPTEEEVNKYIVDILSLRDAAVELAYSRHRQAVISQAQRAGITYEGSTITRFADVGAWWASLSEAQARENAEKMFSIQQRQFEITKWAKRLEETLMTAANLVYHKPPQQAKGRTGCIEMVITQKRINQTKVLTDRSKKGKSHGLFISIKHQRGEGVGNGKRRAMGVFEPWMLQRSRAACVRGTVSF
jgi:hypothetical protein